MVFHLFKKKNHVNVNKFSPIMATKNMYANFFPMNAVSGSSFTLIKSFNYFKQDNII